MFIANFIYDDISLPQWSVNAPTELELMPKIIEYIKSSPHTTLTSQENPETLSPYFESSGLLHCG